MKKHKKSRIWSLITVSLFTIHFSLFTTSCTSETYDSGDGKYSYLRADFVEIHATAPQQIDYALDDDGQRIAFSTPISVKWAEKADTFYRALLYYDRRPDGNTPLSVQRVYMLTPRPAALIDSPVFDPVTFESVWLSRCQLQELRGASHYLNLSFLIKTGQADDKNAIQSIGIASEEDGETLRLKLLHDQGNVPQYYSTRVYVSVPLADKKNVILTVNTYDGEVTHQITP